MTSPTKQKLQHSICWFTTAGLKFNRAPSLSVYKTNRICILIKTHHHLQVSSPFPAVLLLSWLVSCHLPRDFLHALIFATSTQTSPGNLKETHPSSFQQSQLHWGCIWPIDQTSTAVSTCAIPPQWERFSLFANLKCNATFHKREWQS